MLPLFGKSPTSAKKRPQPASPAGRRHVSLRRRVRNAYNIGRNSHNMDMDMDMVGLLCVDLHDHSTHYRLTEQASVVRVPCDQHASHRLPPPTSTSATFSTSSPLAAITPSVRQHRAWWPTYHQLEHDGLHGNTPVLCRAICTTWADETTAFRRFRSARHLDARSSECGR